MITYPAVPPTDDEPWRWTCPACGCGLARDEIESRSCSGCCGGSEMTDQTDLAALLHREGVGCDRTPDGINVDIYGIPNHVRDADRLHAAGVRVGWCQHDFAMLDDSPACVKCGEPYNYKRDPRDDFGVRVTGDAGLREAAHEVVAMTANRTGWKNPEAMRERILAALRAALATEEKP